MPRPSYNEIRRSLSGILKRFHALIAGALFLLGILLRFSATLYSGLLWQIIGDFGTFLAGAIAIPFIYDRYIKTEDRQVFLSELEDVLDAKLHDIETKITHIEAQVATIDKERISPRIYEEGRASQEEVVKFLSLAKREVIHIGTAMNTLYFRFTSVNTSAYKAHIKDLLEKGIKFKFLFLDPNSKITGNFVRYIHEPEMINNIRRNLKTFSKLRDEFGNLPGAFEIYTYARFPTCYLMMIDPDLPDGWLSISPYLHTIKRADNPHILVHKSINPDLFAKYYQVASEIMSLSKKYVVKRH